MLIIIRSRQTATSAWCMNLAKEEMEQVGRWFYKVILDFNCLGFFYGPISFKCVLPTFILSILNNLKKRLLSHLFMLITLYRQTFICCDACSNGQRQCIYSRLDFGWSNDKDAHNLKHTRRGHTDASFEQQQSTQMVQYTLLVI